MINNKLIASSSLYGVITRKPRIFSPLKVAIFCPTIHDKSKYGFYSPLKTDRSVFASRIELRFWIRH